jgi:hypothetical protein
MSIKLSYDTGLLIASHENGEIYFEQMSLVNVNMLIASVESDKKCLEMRAYDSRLDFIHNSMMYKSIVSRKVLIEELKKKLTAEGKNVLDSYENLKPVMTEEKIVLTHNNNKYELLGKYDFTLTPIVFGVACLSDDKQSINLYSLISAYYTSMKTFKRVLSNYHLVKNKVGTTIEDKIKETTQKMRLEFISDFQTHILDAIYKDDIEFLRDAHEDAHIKIDQLESYIMFANIGAKKNAYEFLLSILPQKDILPKKEEKKEEEIIPISGTSNVAAGVAINLLSGPTTPVEKVPVVNVV